MAKLGSPKSNPMNLTKLRKDWMKNPERERLREMNLLRMKLNKPKLSGIIIVNLRTGKTRKPYVGEIKPLIIDYSDPSPEDGYSIPKRKVIKHGKK